MNEPVRGLSSVLTMTPSLTHCQNCFCVVQNSLRSRQIISAVFRFFFFFSFFGIRSLGFGFKASAMKSVPRAVATGFLLPHSIRVEYRDPVATPRGTDLIASAQ